ncbi:MAG: V-type ATP synthase subunit F [Coriobacteriia bacterium]|nr:V-type ATP synthase subunit F [Coriobacteriia bacterium]
MAERIAFIGDSTSVAGFRPLGVAVFPAEDEVAIRAAWDTAAAGGYGIVFVTEAVYAVLADEIATLADRPVPAVTVVPGAGSAGGVGEAKLARAIERAVGTSALIREEEA